MVSKKILKQILKLQDSCSNKTLRSKVLKIFRDVLRESLHKMIFDRELREMLSGVELDGKNVCVEARIFGKNVKVCKRLRTLFGLCLSDDDLNVYACMDPIGNIATKAIYDGELVRFRSVEEFESYVEHMSKT